MATVETSKKMNPAGVYRHPETGVELVATRHPKFGNVQADAFVSAGYEYVGTVDEVEAQEAKSAKTSTKGDDK